MGLKKGIKATGGINISNIVYSTSDTVKRRDPYQLILSGNLNLNLFGYDAPFSFTYSNSQRSYTQPFNRMSFTPRYKWIKAYVGHTSMSFSPYTLSGHSFKGAGVELTPGNWRLALMGGQLKKAVGYDPISTSVAQPSYRRMGYGLKFGYEKGPSGILVNIFTAKDDKASIMEVPENVQLHPMQNLAMGVSGRTSLFGHIALEGEYSVSILNSDLRLVPVQADSTDAGVGSFSSHMSGTRSFDAWSIGAGYQSSIAGLMLRYERIAPDYQTLGAYYFNNDLENFTLSPTLRMLDGRFSLSGNAGVQRNNLDRIRESTTKRFVGAGNINFMISEKWNVAVNYSNFSTFVNMKPQEDPFFRDNMDSLNFYQVTNQVGGSANFTFGESEAPGNIMIFTSYQKANETGAGEQEGSASGFMTANGSYSQVIKNANMTISILYNVNSADGTGLKSLYHGPGITISKTLPDKNIRASLNSTYNRNLINRLKGSSVLSTGLNFSYSPKKAEQGKHMITANLGWVQRFRSAIQSQRREITGTLNYSYAF